MRAYDSPNSSSRVIWGVAGTAGLLLLICVNGWLPLDFGGTDTGHLAVDSTADQFEHLEPAPFENLPVQSEPGEMHIVDVPATGHEDPWNMPEPEGDAPPAMGTAMGNGFDTSIPEIPNAAPPEFEADQFDGHGFENGQYTGERYTTAKPIVDPAMDELVEPDRQNDRPQRYASTEPSPYELVDAETEEDRPFPVSPAAADAPLLDLATIDGRIRDDRIAEAHAQLSRIWFEHPAARETIQRRIDTTARAIFFDPEPHFMPAYSIVSGDTLGRIGKAYGVPWQYIVRLNRVDPKRIRPGDDLKVVRGPFHAHVDLARFTLTVHNHGMYVKQYAIGIGRDGRTPVGEFTVRDKVVNPTYTDPEGRMVSGDDPSNPIGERWLSLGGGYGIHGTINPASIGRAESAGCVRLHNADVAELFDLLGVGSEVVIAH